MRKVCANLLRYGLRRGSLRGMQLRKGGGDAAVALRCIAHRRQPRRHL
jgi:hypothetical protein